ncbi:Competence protein ComM [uncultured Roseburia sp.]|uniref:YifB family Mg chelatase-like AAA ATPase n=1 Tax=Brotonthovivens ammoniilytica TaxID=2981725 RepID=A0ABT2TH03_9FIRM|nr:YifB family Mg chelatase-like AAA ATPase [Brotonthovivens ammoniilytica]MCU6761478.1 YifB family Mg chelatase-like AAA ATPase [Brotonthovivens ammoniilytica]SCI29640.1 Competence protein ComM [uncultured Roseburia sp.]
MYSIVKSAVLRGVEGILIQVEADISPGMPSFEMVGFLASEVKEAKERVRIALKNSGILLPPRRITINFMPGDLRKSGSWFDLAVAAAILRAMNEIPEGILKRSLIFGEVGLNGEVLPVRGMLPAAVLARDHQIPLMFVPESNLQEASVLDGVVVIPVASVEDFIRICKSQNPEKSACRVRTTQKQAEYREDYSEIRGQRMVKRACEIAAAGMHNLLMIGPPGSGKTMAAKRLPTILPNMTKEEMLSLAQVYSVSGKFQVLQEDDVFQIQRPFQAPHHTITAQGMCGGGRYPVPGAVSLAHKGVLFLDEFPEFPRPVIELLRQPLEDKKIRIARLEGTYEYPCDFLLLAAMNPCRCGYYPDLKKCRCTPSSVRRYLSKISRPILDRIDMTVETKSIPASELFRQKPGESSEQIRRRVQAAHEIQRQRFLKKDYSFNSQIPSKDMECWCEVNAETQAYLEELSGRESFSARGYYKLLRTARTIADLEGSEKIQMCHATEASAFRMAKRKYWEGQDEL